jgi:hypothetical protein
MPYIGEYISNIDINSWLGWIAHTFGNIIAVLRSIVKGERCVSRALMRGCGYFGGVGEALS